MSTGTSPVIVHVRQRTPEWREARFEGIGASEAAAAVGLSEWESRVGLWAQKLRLVPPAAETLPMRIGQELEPLIARLYTESTGIKVRRATMLRKHPSHPFMLASLDRRAGRKPIELKYSARGQGYGEPGTDEVPDDVLAQVLHQLAVTDEPEADVAVLVAGRREIQIFTIARDVEAEAALIEAEAEFWHHVETRTEPPIDGSEATRAALAARYPRDDGLTIEADPDTAHDLDDLRVVRHQLEVTEARKLELENRLKAAMGEASLLLAPGVGQVTWKLTKDRETVDWKAVAADLRSSYDLALSLYAKGDLLDIDGVRAWLDDVVPTNTNTTPGQRRFGPPRFEEEEEPA